MAPYDLSPETRETLGSLTLAFDESPGEGSGLVVRNALHLARVVGIIKFTDEATAARWAPPLLERSLDTEPTHGLLPRDTSLQVFYDRGLVGDSDLLSDVARLCQGIGKKGNGLRPDYVSVRLGHSSSETLEKALKIAQECGVILVAKSLSSTRTEADFRREHPEVSLVAHAVNQMKFAHEVGFTHCLTAIDIAEAMAQCEYDWGNQFRFGNGVALQKPHHAHRALRNPQQAAPLVSSLVTSEPLYSPEPMRMATAYAAAMRSEAQT